MDVSVFVDVGQLALTRNTQRTPLVLHVERCWIHTRRKHVDIHRIGGSTYVDGWETMRPTPNAGAATDGLLHGMLQAIELREKITRKEGTVNHASLLEDLR